MRIIEKIILSFPIGLKNIISVYPYMHDIFHVVLNVWNIYAYSTQFKFL
jgi:hypothetical protein